MIAGIKRGGVNFLRDSEATSPQRKSQGASTKAQVTKKAAAVSRCGFLLAEGSSTNKTPPRSDPRRRYEIV